jgi:hypothetical protein
VVSASFTGAGGGTLYTVTATRAWLNANNFTSNYTLTGPTLPGFLAQWAPASPLDEDSVIMLGGNLAAQPTAGSIVNLAVRFRSP